MLDCIFTENRAEMHGGAIANKGGMRVNLERSSFVRNSALTGGALYIISDLDQGDKWGAALTNLIFSENKGTVL